MFPHIHIFLAPYGISRKLPFLIAVVLSVTSPEVAADRQAEENLVINGAHDVLPNAVARGAARVRPRSFKVQQENLDHVNSDRVGRFDVAVSVAGGFLDTTESKGGRKTARRSRTWARRVTDAASTETARHAGRRNLQSLGPEVDGESRAVVAPVRETTEETGSDKAADSESSDAPVDARAGQRKLDKVVTKIVSDDLVKSLDKLESGKQTQKKKAGVYATQKMKSFVDDEDDEEDEESGKPVQSVVGSKEQTKARNQVNAEQAADSESMADELVEPKPGAGGKLDADKVSGNAQYASGVGSRLKEKPGQKVEDFATATETTPDESVKPEAHAGVIDSPSASETNPNVLVKPNTNAGDNVDADEASGNEQDASGVGSRLEEKPDQGIEQSSTVSKPMADDLVKPEPSPGGKLDADKASGNAQDSSGVGSRLEEKPDQGDEESMATGTAETMPDQSVKPEPSAGVIDSPSASETEPDDSLKPNTKAGDMVDADKSSGNAQDASGVARLQRKLDTLVAQLVKGGLDVSLEKSFEDGSVTESDDSRVARLEKKIDEIAAKIAKSGLVKSFEKSFVDDSVTKSDELKSGKKAETIVANKQKKKTNDHQATKKTHAEETAKQSFADDESDESEPGKKMQSVKRSKQENIASDKATDKTNAEEMVQKSFVDDDSDESESLESSKKVQSAKRSKQENIASDQATDKTNAEEMVQKSFVDDESDESEPGKKMQSVKRSKPESIASDQAKDNTNTQERAEKSFAEDDSDESVSSGSGKKVHSAKAKDEESGEESDVASDEAELGKKKRKGKTQKKKSKQDEDDDDVQFALHVSKEQSKHKRRLEAARGPEPDDALASKDQKSGGLELPVILGIMCTISILTILAAFCYFQYTWNKRSGGSSGGSSGEGSGESSSDS